MSITKPAVKDRMAIERCVMVEQDPLERARNFNEVNKGLALETALRESQRCLECKNRPCVSACPVNISIPDFIHEMKNGDFEKITRISRQSVI